MQKKSIEKVVSTKMNEWLNTITDEALRKDVKENLLVSGGCIASMFLSTDVNDFDVYIKDRSVLLKLVGYYTAGMDCVIMDGHKKQELEDDLLSAYAWAENLDDINNQYRIALKNLKEDQVKLFFSGGMWRNEKTDFESKEYAPIFMSPNAISLTDKLQIVIRFHGDDKAIHSTFDFIHATNYFTFETGLVTNLEAIESLLTRQLKYQGSQYPLTSIIRMKKFIKRNWNINAGEMLKIMFQISELDLKNPDVLEEQLIGVDVAYFGKLIEILRGIDDKTKMTSKYLNEIIDRVFNQHENSEEE
jgi:hypothetical protein